jgi:hypothetical protein
VSAQGPISDVLFVGDVSGRDPAPNCRGFLASRWMKYHDLLHVVRDMHYSLPASMMDGDLGRPLFYVGDGNCCIVPLWRMTRNAINVPDNHGMCSQELASEQIT